MMLIRKILRFGWLFCCICLLPCAVSLAQDPTDQNNAQPQPQPSSTTDLESQPNTLNYPRARRRPFVPRPSNNTPNADPTNPDPPANTTQPNNVSQPNNIQPPNPNPRPATPGVAAPANSAPVRSQPSSPPVALPRFFPQPPGFIGPPAPLPPTPEQMAPTAPRITYQNGLLSVESMNARLIDILNGIRSKAGIQFEGLQQSPDRVAGKFGPAPPGEVLTNLLQGSRYDYVIIGTPENPALVQRVILTPTAGAAAAAGNSPAGVEAAQQANGDEDDSSDDDSSAADETAQPQQQQPLPGQPVGENGAKTPEQLLEELKRMQQQSLQQNQQNPNQQNPQNPAPRKPGPPN